MIFSTRMITITFTNPHSLVNLVQAYVVDYESAANELQNAQVR